MRLSQRLAAEWLGTAFCLQRSSASGIMAERLAHGDGALALLCNSLATGTMLAVLILVFGPISGAHFNPLVSLALFMRGELTVATAASYVVAQLAGAFAGVLAAHAMFALPLMQVSMHARSGPRPMSERSDCHLRSFDDDLRMRGAKPGRDALRDRRLYRRGLLVHRLDILRQSRSYARPRLFRHVCRDRARPMSPDSCSHNASAHSPQSHWRLGSGKQCSRSRLIREPEMQHVAISDDIILAFETEFARLTCACLAVCGHVIGIGDGFGADETLLEIGVDHTRRLRRFGADFDRPGAGLFRAYGKYVMRCNSA